MEGQIWQTVGYVVLILLVEHWFPWRLVFGKDLPRLGAYVLGVAAMMVPLTVLYCHWAQYLPARPWSWWYPIALWAVIAAGGLAVVLAWGLDWLFRKLAKLADMEERERIKEEERRERAARADEFAAG